MDDGLESARILAELDAERNRFTKADVALMQAMVDRLVELGVYPQITPTMQKYGYTHLKMVEGWGAYWYVWEEPLSCPCCDADLRDHEAGPPFKKQIGWYENDMTVAYVCPFCRKAFNRFPPSRGELHLSESELCRISNAYCAGLEKLTEDHGD